MSLCDEVTTTIHLLRCCFRNDREAAPQASREQTDTVGNKYVVTKLVKCNNRMNSETQERKTVRKYLMFALR